MRVTNKIMQRNNLSNINTNKMYQDKLSTQMSTQKKINRPSDDPVVAIRSLRLRSNVTEITQYYSKNIPDAESWIKITEDALSKLSDVISNMAAQCTRGTNSPFTTTDRATVLEQLKLLGDEVYATGDADFAGRYVFTGYRTDTPLSFLTAKTQNYTITEQLDKGAIDSVSKVETDKLLDINSSNYMDINVTEDDISSTEVHRIRLAYKNCSNYDEYDSLKEQQDDLKKKLEGYKPYLENADTGFDLDDLDFNNLTDADLAKIDQAIDAAIKKAAAAQGIATASLAAESPAISSRAADGNGEIDTDITTILAWEKIPLDNLQALKTWTDEWTKNQDAMENLDAASPTIEFTDSEGNTNIWTGFTRGASAGTATQADNPVIETGVITLMHSYDKNPNPYIYAAENADAIVYVPETGEILLGSNRYEKLMATKDSEATSSVNEAEIRVTYDKSSWDKGNLRPEHYFYCQADKEDGSGNRITYNEDYLTPGAERQVIEYDVGFNQTIRINSRADECFNHGIGREVDDIINAMQNVQNLEGVQADIKSIMKKLDEADPNMAVLQKQLDAVEKALTYAKDKEQKMFEGGITAFQKYLDGANLCVTACGSRSSKLELIKNRSQNQKTTYETLKSENEDIDITEVAIQLTSAELTYDAALMAAGKVMQSSLMNFI